MFARTALLLLFAAGCAAQTATSFEGIPISPISAKTLEEVATSREYVDLENSQPANELAKQATQAEPGSILVWLQLANAASTPEELAAAIQRAAALAEGATEAERLLLGVQQSLVDNNTDEALKLAEQLTALAPQSPRAHLILYGVHTARGEHPAARAAAEKAITLDPTSASGHVLIGESWVFSEPKDFEKAEGYLKKLVELRPASAAAWISLGDCRRAMLKLELAREDYATAEKVEPSYPVSPIKQGHVSSFLGRFDDARRDYDRGLKIGKPETRFSLANFKAFVSLHADQPREALAQLHTYLREIDASELSPAEKNSAKTFMLANMATIAFHIGDREEAKKAVDALTRVFESSAAAVEAPAVKRRLEADARLWQAYLAAYEDQPDAALARANEYRALLEADKNPRKEQQLHALLGLIELRQKKHEQAIDHYRAADLQTDVYAKYQLAVALKASGKADEAKKLFKEVAEWSFNSVAYALVRRAAAAEL